MSSQVLGTGPVGFTDNNEGKQYFIPLSVLYFDDKNKIQADKWPPYNDNDKNFKDMVNDLLNTLVTQGFLTASPQKPPQQALILKAAVPGAAGNNIQVTFKKSDDSDATKFDATISETETYEGLSWNKDSLAYIKQVLGTEKGGLVHILDTDAPNSPPEGAIYYLKLPKDPNNNEPDEAKQASVSVPTSDGTTSFTLEARKSGPDGEKTTVTIAVGAETFSLTAVWEQSVTQITLGTLSDQLKEGGKYLISVEPPKNGTFTIIPAPGTVRLSGGADKKEALPASATVFGS